MGCHFVLLSVCFIREARGQYKIWYEEERPIFKSFMEKINNLGQNYSNVTVINPSNVLAFSSTRFIKNKTLWVLSPSASSGGEEMGALICLAR